MESNQMTHYLGRIHPDSPLDDLHRRVLNLERRSIQRLCHRDKTENTDSPIAHGNFQAPLSRTSSGNTNPWTPVVRVRTVQEVLDAESPRESSSESQTNGRHPRTCKRSRTSHRLFGTLLPWNGRWGFVTVGNDAFFAPRANFEQLAVEPRAGNMVSFLVRTDVRRRNCDRACFIRIEGAQERSPTGPM